MQAYERKSEVKQYDPITGQPRAASVARTGAVNQPSSKSTAFASTQQSALIQSNAPLSSAVAASASPAPAADRADALDPAPVELEHMIGFSARFRNTVQWLLSSPGSAGTDKKPSALSKFVYSVGATVALGDLSDPHKQRFMNGHDELVSAIAVSPNGHLIASGQLGSKAAKGESSPVCVWDTRTGARVLQLEGLAGQVLALSFSPDGKLLAASGLNAAVVVWQLEALAQQQQAPLRWEATVIHSERVPAPATCAQFSPVLLAGPSRYPSYTLITTPGDKVRKTSLQFDTRTMGFAAETVAFSFPARGLVRNYVRCAFDEKGETVFIATEAGDVAVLNVPNAIFRAAVQVSSNGVRGVAVRGDYLFAAAGDGVLKRFRGADAVWNADAQVKLGEALSSLSWHGGSSPAGELLVSGERGRIFTVSCDTLQAKVAAESSSAPLRAACFGKRADSFCSFGQDGAIMVWDLADYSVPVRIQVPAEGVCIGYAEDGSIVCGSADGAIRSYSARDGKELWSVPNAHRGAVLCLSFNAEHVMSGGEDGYVRVWQTATRRMAGAYLAHKGPVRSVVADVKNPRRIHSCGDDKSIISFDLHTEQRAATHLEQSGPLTAMGQKIDGDYELLTVSSHGHIALWDSDIDGAVARMVDPGRTRLSSVHLSPNGKLFAVAGDDGFVKIYSIIATNAVPAAAPSRPAQRGAPLVPATSVQLQLQLVAACKGHSAPVTTVRWAPDQRQLVSTGSDGAICVWNFYG